jgi:hypothetical protein
MAQALELAPEVPKMHWAGDNGNVPPWKSCIHTASVTQYGMAVVCMTSYVGMGLPQMASPQSNAYLPGKYCECEPQ